jgi:hypothetical protein
MACQDTLEAEIREVLAEGEDEKIFSDPEQGIWFGGINRPNNGKLSINILNDPKDSYYSKHLNRVMNSPPKKRRATPARRGGGLPQPHLINNPTSNTNSLSTNTFHTPNQPTVAMATASLNQKFDSIRIEINNQRQQNAIFDERIRA